MTNKPEITEMIEILRDLFYIEQGKELRPDNTYILLHRDNIADALSKAIQFIEQAEAENKALKLEIQFLHGTINGRGGYKEFTQGLQQQLDKVKGITVGVIANTIADNSSLRAYPARMAGKSTICYLAQAIHNLYNPKTEKEGL